MEEVVRTYHADTLYSFRNYKQLAERAIEQLSDEQFFAVIDNESNCVALIVKHMAGNLHSRWRDFLTTDGEKPGRNRETEFELIGDTRELLMKFWESGWDTLFRNLEPLKPEDFAKTITIRGEPHTVCQATNRQLTHYAYHVGQIVFLAKHLTSSNWKNLSVPKKQSEQFNRFLADQQASGGTTSDRFGSVERFRDETS